MPKLLHIYLQFISFDFWVILLFHFVIVPYKTDKRARLGLKLVGPYVLLFTKLLLWIPQHTFSINATSSANKQRGVVVPGYMRMPLTRKMLVYFNIELVN